MSTLLETKNLKKYFDVPNGKLHAVDNVNLKIEKGTTLGVVGESGCGKSTLGKLIMKLQQPTSGQILFDGVPQEVFSHVRELKDVGLDVPQATELCYELRQAGFPLPEDIITEEAAAEAISALLEAHR